MPSVRITAPQITGTQKFRRDAIAISRSKRLRRGNRSDHFIVTSFAVLDNAQCSH